MSLKTQVIIVAAITTALGFYFAFRGKIVPKNELVEAIKKEDAAKALQVIQRGADVNATEANGTTPLMRAAAIGNTRVLEIVLAARPALDAINSEGSTALMLASHKGHADAAGLLIKAGANPSLLNQAYMNARDLAELAGHLPIAELLAQAGARSNLKNHELRTAIQNGNLVELQRLLDAGMDAEARAPDGTTALMIAADRCDTRAAALLLENKAGPDRQRKEEGTTALMIACHRGCLEMVELLLSRQADPRIPDRNSVTALDYAASAGHQPLVERLEKTGVASAEKNGRFREAVAEENLESIRKDLETGADCNHRLFDGTTPLMLAANTHNPAVVKLLIEKGAEPNAKRGNGETALMIAAAAGSAEVVQLLLDAGADWDARNERRKTAADLAEEAGHNSVAALIRSKSGKQ